MASQNIQKYLQEEAIGQECKDLISTLPTQKGWFDSSYLYQYKGFWFQPDHLQAIISRHKDFQVRDSDILLATFPKCGTTWLKAIIFTLLNRKQYPVESEDHPLRTTNPHDLAISMEIDINTNNDKIQIRNPSPDSSRRFLATHMPYVSLPECLKSSPSVKVVYVCRNPKDTFVSLWHFTNNLGFSKTEIGEVFDMFCEGVVWNGPFWEHVLEYWRKSRESPERVLFMKYEDMKEEAAVELRRLAEFLECGFSEEEEEGVVEKILKLTSFDSLSVTAHFSEEGHVIG